MGTQRGYAQSHPGDESGGVVRIWQGVRPLRAIQTGTRASGNAPLVDKFKACLRRLDRMQTAPDKIALECLPYTSQKSRYDSPEYANASQETWSQDGRQLLDRLHCSHRRKRN